MIIIVLEETLIIVVIVVVIFIYQSGHQMVSKVFFDLFLVGNMDLYCNFLFAVDFLNQIYPVIFYQT